MPSEWIVLVPDCACCKRWYRLSWYCNSSNYCNGESKTCSGCPSHVKFNVNGSVEITVQQGDNACVGGNGAIVPTVEITSEERARLMGLGWSAGEVSYSPVPPGSPPGRCGGEGGEHTPLGDFAVSLDPRLVVLNLTYSITVPQCWNDDFDPPAVTASFAGETIQLTNESGYNYRGTYVMCMNELIAMQDPRVEFWFSVDSHYYSSMAMVTWNDNNEDCIPAYAIGSYSFEGSTRVRVRADCVPDEPFTLRATDYDSSVPDGGVYEFSFRGTTSGETTETSICYITAGISRIPPQPFGGFELDWPREGWVVESRYDGFTSSGSDSYTFNYTVYVKKPVILAVTLVQNDCAECRDISSGFTMTVQIHGNPDDPTDYRYETVTFRPVETESDPDCERYPVSFNKCCRQPYSITDFMGYATGVCKGQTISAITTVSGTAPQCITIGDFSQWESAPDVWNAVVYDSENCPSHYCFAFVEVGCWGTEASARATMNRLKDHVEIVNANGDPIGAGDQHTQFGFQVADDGVFVLCVLSCSESILIKAKDNVARSIIKSAIGSDGTIETSECDYRPSGVCSADRCRCVSVDGNVMLDFTLQAPTNCANILALVSGVSFGYPGGSAQGLLSYSDGKLEATATASVSSSVLYDNLTGACDSSKIPVTATISMAGSASSSVSGFADRRNGTSQSGDSTAQFVYFGTGNIDLDNATVNISIDGLNKKCDDGTNVSFVVSYGGDTKRTVLNYKDTEDSFRFDCVSPSDFIDNVQITYTIPRGSGFELKLTKKTSKKPPVVDFAYEVVRTDNEIPIKANIKVGEKEIKNGPNKVREKVCGDLASKKPKIGGFGGFRFKRWKGLEGIVDVDEDGWPLWMPRPNLLGDSELVAEYDIRINFEVPILDCKGIPINNGLPVPETLFLIVGDSEDEDSIVEMKKDGNEYRTQPYSWVLAPEGIPENVKVSIKAKRATGEGEFEFVDPWHLALDRPDPFVKFRYSGLIGSDGAYYILSTDWHLAGQIRHPGLQFEGYYPPRCLHGRQPYSHIFYRSKSDDTFEAHNKARGDLLFVTNNWHGCVDTSYKMDPNVDMGCEVFVMSELTNTFVSLGKYPENHGVPYSPCCGPTCVSHFPSCHYDPDPPEPATDKFVWYNLEYKNRKGVEYKKEPWLRNPSPPPGDYSSCVAGHAMLTGPSIFRENEPQGLSVLWYTGPVDECPPQYTFWPKDPEPEEIDSNDETVTLLQYDQCSDATSGPSVSAMVSEGMDGHKCGGVLEMWGYTSKWYPIPYPVHRVNWNPIGLTININATADCAYPPAATPPAYCGYTFAGSSLYKEQIQDINGSPGAALVPTGRPARMPHHEVYEYYSWTKDRFYIQYGYAFAANEDDDPSNDIQPPPDFEERFEEAISDTDKYPESFTVEDVGGPATSWPETQSQNQ